ncbi:Na-translocating system protein MpsB, partial [Xanthomonas perforans]|nr:Na-translocating system protein MpsB [Xanthomonas perforans]
ANAEDAIVDCVARLGLSQDALDGYFHRLLTTLGGWGQLARYRLWQAELSGATDACVTDLLAVRLLWEAALLGNGGCTLVPGWQRAVAAYAEPVAATSDDVIDSILQEAAERAAQRKLSAVLAAPSPAQVASGRVKLQMAFCID